MVTSNLEKSLTLFLIGLETMCLVRKGAGIFSFSPRNVQTS